MQSLPTPSTASTPSSSTITRETTTKTTKTSNHEQLPDNIKAMTVYSVAKAGMTEDSVARINRIVYEYSKDSPHYLNQQRKDEKNQFKIQTMLGTLNELEKQWQALPSNILFLAYKSMKKLQNQYHWNYPNQYGGVYKYSELLIKNVTMNDFNHVDVDATNNDLLLEPNQNSILSYPNNHFSVYYQLLAKLYPTAFPSILVKQSLNSTIQPPHSLPLQKHSSPLQTHSLPLQTHSSPLQAHSSPLQTHSSSLQTHSIQSKPPECLVQSSHKSSYNHNYSAILSWHFFAHVDLDAFFASASLLEYPHLIDKPVAIGNMQMISTSNYIARTYGVRSAQPGFLGKKLCPQLIFLPHNGKLYHFLVDNYVRPLLSEYDPGFTSISLDEATMDMSSSYVFNYYSPCCHLVESKAVFGPICDQFKTSTLYSLVDNITDMDNDNTLKNDVDIQNEMSKSTNKSAILMPNNDQIDIFAHLQNSTNKLTHGFQYQYYVKSMQMYYTTLNNVLAIINFDSTNKTNNIITKGNNTLLNASSTSGDNNGPISINNDINNPTPTASDKSIDIVDDDNTININNNLNHSTKNDRETLYDSNNEHLLPLSQAQLTILKKKFPFVPSFPSKPSLPDSTNLSTKSNQPHNIENQQPQTKYCSSPSNDTSMSPNTSYYHPYALSPSQIPHHLQSNLLSPCSLCLINDIIKEYVWYKLGPTHEIDMKVYVENLFSIIHSTRMKDSNPIEGNNTHGSDLLHLMSDSGQLVTDLQRTSSTSQANLKDNSKVDAQQQLNSNDKTSNLQISTIIPQCKSLFQLILMWKIDQLKHEIDVYAKHSHIVLDSLAPGLHEVVSDFNATTQVFSHTTVHSNHLSQNPHFDDYLTQINTIEDKYRGIIPHSIGPINTILYLFKTKELAILKDIVFDIDTFLAKINTPDQKNMLDNDISTPEDPYVKDAALYLDNYLFSHMLPTRPLFSTSTKLANEKPNVDGAVAEHQLNFTQYHQSIVDNYKKIGRKDDVDDITAMVNDTGSNRMHQNDQESNKCTISFKFYSILNSIFRNLSQLHQTHQQSLALSSKCLLEIQSRSDDGIILSTKEVTSRSNNNGSIITTPASIASNTTPSCTMTTTTAATTPTPINSDQATTPTIGNNCTDPQQINQIKSDLPTNPFPTTNFSLETLKELPYPRHYHRAIYRYGRPIHPSQLNTIIFNDILTEIRIQMYRITHLTGSFGLAPTSMLAKIGSDVQKPFGHCIIPSNLKDTMSFLSKLNIRKIPGVGMVLEKTLNALGVTRCGDVHNEHMMLRLKHVLGNIGFTWLIRSINGGNPFGMAFMEAMNTIASNGSNDKGNENIMNIFGNNNNSSQINYSVDNDMNNYNPTTHGPVPIVGMGSDQKSMSYERTFASTGNVDFICHLIDKLCTKIYLHSKQDNVVGKTVTIKVKYSNFVIKQRSKTLNNFLHDRLTQSEAQDQYYSYSRLQFDESNHQEVFNNYHNDINVANRHEIQPSSTENINVATTDSITHNIQIPSKPLKSAWLDELQTISKGLFREEYKRAVKEGIIGGNNDIVQCRLIGVRLSTLYQAPVHVKGDSKGTNNVNTSSTKLTLTSITTPTTNSSINHGAHQQKTSRNSNFFDEMDDLYGDSNLVNNSGNKLKKTSSHIMKKLGFSTTPTTSSLNSTSTKLSRTTDQIINDDKDEIVVKQSDSHHEVVKDTNNNNTPKSIKFQSVFDEFDDINVLVDNNNTKTSVKTKGNEKNKRSLSQFFSNKDKSPHKTNLTLKSQQINDSDSDIICIESDSDVKPKTGCETNVGKRKVVNLINPRRPAKSGPTNKTSKTLPTKGSILNSFGASTLSSKHLHDDSDDDIIIADSSTSNNHKSSQQTRHKVADSNEISMKDVILIDTESDSMTCDSNKISSKVISQDIGSNFALKRKLDHHSANNNLDEEDPTTNPPTNDHLVHSDLNEMDDIGINNINNVSHTPKKARKGEYSEDENDETSIFFQDGSDDESDPFSGSITKDPIMTLGDQHQSTVDMEKHSIDEPTRDNEPNTNQNPNVDNKLDLGSSGEYDMDKSDSLHQDDLSIVEDLANNVANIHNNNVDEFKLESFLSRTLSISMAGMITQLELDIEENDDQVDSVGNYDTADHGVVSDGDDTDVVVPLDDEADGFDNVMPIKTLNQSNGMSTTPIKSTKDPHKDHSIKPYTRNSLEDHVMCEVNNTTEAPLVEREPKNDYFLTQQFGQLIMTAEPLVASILSVDTTPLMEIIPRFDPETAFE